MSIALNITTAPQPLRSKVVVNKPPAPVLKKSKSKNSTSNIFQFQFGAQATKPKAIVARRRVVKPAVAQGVLQKSVKNLVPSREVKVVPVKSAEPAKSTVDDDLMLNVCVLPQSQAALNKAKHVEEKRKKWQDKKDKRNSHPVLTDAELQEGIRKFTKNKVKPRVAPPVKLPSTQIVQEHESMIATVETLPKEETRIIVAAQRPPKSKGALIKQVDLFTRNPETVLIGQRLVKPITESLFDGTKVETLPLHPHAIKNLADLLGITELTTVQKKTIPEALAGKDVLVRSQTGSGKTLAYALPIVEQLHKMRPKITRDAGILALVVVPTRELAVQTYELFQKLLKPFTWVVSGVLMGGEKRKAEKARLRKGLNILVGTPGRLVDHLLHTESFKLNKVQFLALDEADRLLEMGYERDVKQIVEAIDKQRLEGNGDNTASTTAGEESAVGIQRFLLSATLTAAVQNLAGLTLKNPTYIDNSDEGAAIRASGGYSKEAIEELQTDLLEDGDETDILTIPDNLKLHFLVTPPKLRLVTLSGLLAKEYAGKQKLKAIIFMSTTEMVEFHHSLLNEQLTKRVLDEDDEKVNEEHESDEDEGEKPLLKGLRFFKLHGAMTQTERQGVFQSFRESTSGVLLTTDVAGRGVDVPEVNLVIQYSPPQKVADFVHRVGRTARAGRSGRAILFLTPSEAPFVRFLEDKRIRISQIDMDDYLKALKEADAEANNVQEAASNLQHKFQLLIDDDREMHDKACKAFVSWMKFYSTFPKQLKSTFNIKNVHMGHFAKSFALKDQPTSFAKQHSMPKPKPPTNRLTYTERDPEKLKQEAKKRKHNFGTTVRNEMRSSNRPAPNKLIKMLAGTRMLNTSEFDSGLPPMKKKKKK